MDKKSFQAPPLPFGWLATTFIAPTVIAVLSYVLSNKNLSLSACVIIGLSLFSAMMIVACIILAFQRFSEAFDRQLIDYKLSETAINLKETKTDLIEIAEKIDSQNRVLKERIMNLEQRVQTLSIDNKE